MKLTILILLIPLVLACSSSTPDVDTNVELTLEHDVTGNTLHIHGTTNLPNGALLYLQIVGPGVGGMPPMPYETLNTWRTVEVQNSSYSTELDLKPYQPSTATIFMTFRADDSLFIQQPSFIIDAFGDNGENMEGELVNESGGVKSIDLIEEFSWSTFPD